MNILPLNKLSVISVGMISLTAAAFTTLADDTVPSAVASPALPYGVPQIIQLSQSHLSDTTIVTYVRNSGNSYGLDADQIIYLQQQGVSETVINAMLTQPKPGIATVAYAPVTTVAAPPQDYTVVLPPPAPVTVTEVPASSVYVIPDSATYRYVNTYASYGGYNGFSPVCATIGVGSYYGGIYSRGGCYSPAYYRAGCYRGGWYR